MTNKIISTAIVIVMIGISFINSYNPEPLPLLDTKPTFDFESLVLSHDVVIEASPLEKLQAILEEQEKYEIQLMSQEEEYPLPETSIVEEPTPPAPTTITHTEHLPGLAEFYNTYAQYYKSDTTCHPYIIASIHYRETNFGNTNGWNGQGAFQNLSNRYPAGSVVTDWEVQVSQACLHAKGKVGVQTLLDLNDYETVGTALARYNGCMGKYYKQCSYTVNKTNLMSSGVKCAVDGCAYTTTDNRFGALSIISQLKELRL